VSVKLKQSPPQWRAFSFLARRSKTGRLARFTTRAFTVPTFDPIFFAEKAAKDTCAPIPAIWASAALIVDTGIVVEVEAAFHAGADGLSFGHIVQFGVKASA